MSLTLAPCTQHLTATCRGHVRTHECSTFDDPPGGGALGRLPGVPHAANSWCASCRHWWRPQVALKRAAGHSHILALDIGAGSGLLSMMAMRCGCPPELVATAFSTAQRAPTGFTSIPSGASSANKNLLQGGGGPGGGSGDERPHGGRGRRSGGGQWLRHAHHDDRQGRPPHGCGGTLLVFSGGLSRELALRTVRCCTFSPAMSDIYLLCVDTNRCGSRMARRLTWSAKQTSWCTRYCH